jgi:ATP phosphoribosyltransferase regulatory subunit
MDLLTLANLTPLAQRQSAIVAPWTQEADLANKITELRDAGEVVIQALGGDDVETAEYLCDRELVKQDNSWVVKKK